MIRSLVSFLTHLFIIVFDCLVLVKFIFIRQERTIDIKSLSFWPVCISVELHLIRYVLVRICVILQIIESSLLDRVVVFVVENHSNYAIFRDF